MFFWNFEEIFNFLVKILMIFSLRIKNLIGKFRVSQIIKISTIFFNFYYSTWGIKKYILVWDTGHDQGWEYWWELRCWVDCEQYTLTSFLDTTTPPPADQLLWIIVIKLIIVWIYICRKLTLKAICFSALNARCHLVNAHLKNSS